jgi:hypothetical protein
MHSLLIKIKNKLLDFKELIIRIFVYFVKKHKKKKGTR